VTEADSDITGDQLQKDVEYWMSPPDPSINQDFFWKARHAGTAAWFFKSKALTEWKARGSLLCIYGKRMSFDTRRVPCTNNLLVF
jgi:hypothetical protein